MSENDSISAPHPPISCDFYSESPLEPMSLSGRGDEVRVPHRRIAEALQRQPGAITSRIKKIEDRTADK